MNGHIFAVFGLYGYFQLTRSTAAHSLAAGGTAVDAAIIDTIRNPGWLSHYCLTYRVTSTSYHKVHVSQLYQLFAFAGDASFARIADPLVLEDSPTAQRGGRALSAGDHTVLSSDGPGKQMHLTRLTLSKAEAASRDRRAKPASRDGIFPHLTSGNLRNSWVQEIPKRSYIRLCREAGAFVYPQLLRFPKRTYTGHNFNINGASAAKLTQTLGSASSAYVSLRATCNKALYCRVLDGMSADWWIPDDTRVALL